MVRNRLLLLLSFFVFSLQAQQAYYLCYFLDKPDFNLESINPLNYLSEKSLERRAINNVDFSESDYPVYQAYLDSLKELSIPIKVTSKWFNASLVLLDSSQKVRLESKPYVDSLVLVSKYLSGSNKPKVASKLGSVVSVVGQHFINETALQSFSERGKGVKIAVFDAGFLGLNTISEFQHLFEDGRLKSFDFLDADSNVFQYHDHGTMVMSILAAENTIAPNAMYELYVTEDVSIETRVEEVYWLKAAELADSSGVNIINSSLGYSLFHNLKEEDYELTDLDGLTSIISRAANFATSKGITVVVSAGNDGEVADWGKLIVPADAFDVITVGAVGHDGIKPGFSSIGPTEDNRIKPEIMALGVDVEVINKNGSKTTANGTSFSAPAVAGVSALLLQQNKNRTREQIKERIVKSGNIYPDSNSEYGYGILDFGKLMGIPKAASGENTYSFSIQNDAINFVNPNKEKISIGVYSIDGKVYYQNSGIESLFVVPFPIVSTLVIVKVVSESGTDTFLLPTIR